MISVLCPRMFEGGRSQSANIKGTVNRIFFKYIFELWKVNAYIQGTLNHVDK